MSSCEDDGHGTPAIGETAGPYRCLAPQLDTWEGRIVRIEFYEGVGTRTKPSATSPKALKLPARTC